ncbi:MAG TPA: peptidase E, partial [Miltoncostaeaceae bacterium]|nr:peptidase E [Miltoncostaeaceae bacterium]
MTRHIIACGGDGWPTDPGRPAMEERILGAARRDNPRVLLLPTASGDSDHLITRFYEFFTPRGCRPDHLALFRPHPRRVDLAAQDVVYVGGGSTLNLMALLELHGLADPLRAAYHAGTVMSGVSAGAICWFRAGLSNSGGAGFAPVAGLGLLPDGVCPHADGDPARIPALEREVTAGRMPASYALDDGAALVFADERLVEVVSARPGRGARRLEPGDGG